jgi:hypothetical protein
MLLNSKAIIYKRRNTSMRGSGMMGVLLMAGALASTGIVAGCAHPHHDYDTVSVSWNAGEEPYYERWEHDTHRDHSAWESRNADEQHQYWAWRHDHQ